MLNFHGGKQYYGVNYLENYSRAITWFSIITLLTLFAIKKWHLKQVDFVQEYPQAPIEYDLYMELPKGFKTKEGDVQTHILKLLKNLYGQTQAGRVWNNHLNNALREVRFKQSDVEECVWYRDETIFL